MGCGSSNRALSKVVELDPSKPPPLPKSRTSSAKSKIVKPKSAQSSSSLRFFSGRKRENVSPSVSRPASGQTAATVSGVNVRTQSATSAHSSDSGIGQDARNSPGSLSKPDPLLPILANIEPPERVDEKKILDSLKVEGLLNSDATETTKGGVKFELDLGELQPPKRRPPPRLARLERTQQMQLTRQRIKEKLETAEQRRKIREQEKVEKSRDRDTKNLEVKLALLEIEKSMEKDRREALSNKIDQHTYRRDTIVQQVVEKQIQHDQKILETSMRKATLVINNP